MPSSRGLLAFASVCSLTLLVETAAWAETSAADKAAARQVATEGIQLFKSQKYADALDRMKRAQALYDAPVHLLYIARAEEKLGLLVEASEHYRQLDHYTLPAKAPEAWTAAVEDGRRELASLEPRVPKLRVLTEPAVSDAGLRIDGADVPSAAIGIPRPINPGKHRVELATPGQQWSSADVEVAEGTTRDVVFRVQPGNGAVVAPAPVVTSEVVAPNPPPVEQPASSVDAQKEGPFVGFLGSLRLGGAVPTGTVFAVSPGAGSNATSIDVQMSDVTQPGGAIEFQAGIRLGRYFTPLFFLAGQTLGHPSTYRLAQPITFEVNKAQAASFGIGVRFGTPPGKIGAFGELDIGLVDALSVELKRQSNAGETTGTCKIDVNGASLRLGGGAIVPIVTWLQLTPVANVSFGRFTNRSATGCDVPVDGDIASRDQRTHAMIFLGVGGDVVIGGRR